MMKDEDTKDFEEEAVNWGPAEYRRWVQQNVADRITRKIFTLVGGIGLVTFGSMAWFVYTKYDQFVQEVSSTIIDDTVARAERTIKADLPTVIQPIVTAELLSQTRLVESAEEQLIVDLDNTLKTITDGELFQARAVEIMIEALDESEGVEKVIIKNALLQARSNNSPAIRALGIELYALLAISNRKEEISREVRKIFVEIAEAHDGPISPELLEAMLRYYPLNETDTCGDPNNCAAWDERMVRAVLHQIADDDDAYFGIENVYLAFFEKIEATQYDLIVKSTIEAPENGALQAINRQIAGTQDVEVASAVATRLAAYSGSEAGEDVRRIALTIIGELDPHLEMDFDDRKQALLKVWSENIDSLRRLHAPDSRIDGTELNSASTDLAELARKAVLKLLRSRPETDNRNDWDEIILERRTTDQLLGPDALTYSLWSERALLDDWHSGPAPYAADRVLGALLRGGTRTSSRIDPSNAAYAIRMASNAQFNMFVGALHRELSEEQPRRQNLERLVIEVVGREQQGTTGFLWLKAIFGDTGATDPKLRDASLFGLGSDLSGFDDEQMVDWDKAAALTNAVSFLSSAIGSDSPDLMVGADLVAGEFMQRFDQEACSINVALEDAGLFERFDPVDAGSAELSGTILSLASRSSWALRDQASLLDPVVAGPDESYSKNIGELRRGITKWLPLTLSQPANVKLEAPENVALSVRRAGGGPVLFRTSAGTPTTQYLSGGDYDIAVRSCTNIETENIKTGSDAAKSELDIRVTTISGPPILPVTPRDAPYDLAEGGAIVYDGAAESGELWLRTELAADETIVLKTSRYEPADSVDTMVVLFDSANGEILAENDDSGSDSPYSYVEHHAASDTEILVHVTKYSETQFGTGDSFRIDALILTPDKIIEPTATVDGAPDMGRASSTLLRIADEERRFLSVTPARTAIYDVGGTNLDFDLFLAGTPVQPLRTHRSDGSKLYVLQEDTSYLISTRQLEPDGLLAEFRMLPDDKMIDLGRETPPADGISIDNGATLLLPPSGGPLHIRASQSGDAEVIVTGASGTGFTAVLEIENDDTGADPLTITLAPLSDGVLSGWIPVTADVTYRASFGLSGLSNVAGVWIGPAQLRSTRSVPLELSTIPAQFNFDGSNGDGGIWLRATLATGDQLYVETRTLVSGEPGGSVDTLINIYDAETELLIDTDDDGGTDFFSKIEWIASDARNVLIEIVRIDGRLEEGDVFSVEVRLEPASAQ